MGKVPKQLRKHSFKKGSSKSKKSGGKGGRKSRPGGRKKY